MGKAVKEITKTDGYVVIKYGNMDQLETRMVMGEVLLLLSPHPFPEQACRKIF